MLKSYKFQHLINFFKCGDKTFALLQNYFAQLALTPINIRHAERILDF